MASNVIHRKMKLAIRPADLIKEREKLISFLARNLPQLDHRRQFDWLYHQNPAGEGLAWFVYYAHSGEVVGSASVFPRRLWIGRETKTCGQVGAFAVEPAHRSLGPALMLQRATFEPVDRGELALCYDCPPHEKGMAPFRRMGMRPAARVHRYARLLRIGPWLARRLRVRESIVSPVAVLVDAVLSGGQRAGKHREIEVDLLRGNFDEEFTELDLNVGSNENVIRGHRSAAELNWRYRKNPLRTYKVLTAREGGELSGFLIYSISERVGEIVDLFCTHPERAAPALLEEVTLDLKREGVDRVQAFVTDPEAAGRPLERSRFYRRESTEYVVPYTSPGSGTHERLQEGLRWAFTLADIVS